MPLTTIYPSIDIELGSDLSLQYKHQTLVLGFNIICVSFSLSNIVRTYVIHLLRIYVTILCN